MWIFSGRTVIRAAVALEDVRDADEAGDELGLRMLVDLGRRADLLDPALVEDGDPVAHRERLFLVVGDVDERDPELALERLELDLHLLAQLQVERAERLVEQQHRRRVDDRPRERDALALPARELHRLAVADLREAHRAEHLLRLGARARAVAALHAQAVLDVLLHGHVREERVVLEDRVDVALERRHARDVVAAELDVPASGCSKPAIMRSVVVLPEPDGPSIVKNSPRRSRGRAVDRDDVAVARGECRSGAPPGSPRRAPLRLSRSCVQATPPGSRARARAPRPSSRAAPAAGSRCRTCRRRAAGARARAPPS